MTPFAPPPLLTTTLANGVVGQNAGADTGLSPRAEGVPVSEGDGGFAAQLQASQTDGDRGAKPVLAGLPELPEWPQAAPLALQDLAQTDTALRGDVRARAALDEGTGIASLAAEQTGKALPQTGAILPDSGPSLTQDPQIRAVPGDPAQGSPSQNAQQLQSDAARLRPKPVLPVSTVLAQPVLAQGEADPALVPSAAPPALNAGASRAPTTPKPVTDLAVTLPSQLPAATGEDTNQNLSEAAGESTAKRASPQPLTVQGLRPDVPRGAETSALDLPLAPSQQAGPRIEPAALLAGEPTIEPQAKAMPASQAFDRTERLANPGSGEASRATLASNLASSPWIANAPSSQTGDIASAAVSQSSGLSEALKPAPAVTPVATGVDGEAIPSVAAQAQAPITADGEPLRTIEAASKPTGSTDISSPKPVSAAEAARAPVDPPSVSRDAATFAAQPGADSGAQALAADLSAKIERGSSEPLARADKSARPQPVSGLAIQALAPNTPEASAPVAQTEPRTQGGAAPAPIPSALVASDTLAKASPARQPVSVLSEGSAPTKADSKPTSRTIESRIAAPADLAAAQLPAETAARGVPTEPAIAAQTTTQPNAAPALNIAPPVIASPVPLASAPVSAPPTAITPGAAGGGNTIDQLVEQVADAREAGRSARPELTLRHAEFGTVGMRIDTSAGASVNDWRATLFARDPGFVPAVQAAITDRAIAAASESGLAQNGSSQNGSSQRSSEHNSQGSSHSGSQQSGMANGGAQDQRYGSSTGSGQGSAQPYLSEEALGGSDTTAARPGEASAQPSAQAEGGALFA